MAVLFDLDGTLYDIVLPMREALQQIAPPEMRPTIEERFWRSYFAMEDTFPNDLREFIGALLESATGIPEWKQKADELLELFLSRIKLFDGVEPLLERLASSNTVLGMVTNGPLVFQLAKIDRLGLKPWFGRSNVITPEIAGAAKPSPVIFRYSCELLGVRPEDSIFVGDNPLTDLGAVEAGMNVVLIDKTWNNADLPLHVERSTVFPVRCFEEAALVITRMAISRECKGVDPGGTGTYSKRGTCSN
ncbi:MAG TPA: HAD family hydrolase [Firmicutes bacterium]|nr:HAD family hydrolase [Bacillota bacterium]